MRKNNNSTNKIKPRRRRNQRPTGVGAGSPLIREFPPTKEIVSVVNIDGAAQDTANTFVVCDFRLMDFSVSTMAGGTGAFTAAYTGIADMTAYALGRARSFEIDLDGTSAEGTNLLTVGLAFSDTQISTVATTNALAHSSMISGLHIKPFKLSTTTGQPRFNVRKFRLTPEQIVGDRMVQFDRDFVSTINPAHVAPNQELWGALIVATTGANLTLGCFVNCVITTRVHASSRLPGR
jgi:hypothetical protein